MSEQTPIRAESGDDRAISDRAVADRANSDGAIPNGGQDGTESDLERYGLGPEDQDPTEDPNELLSGADATQERDSALNRFGLGPEE